jgi:hypothetical protein
VRQLNLNHCVLEIDYLDPWPSTNVLAAEVELVGAVLGELLAALPAEPALETEE